MKTPVSEHARQRFGSMSPTDAVVRAWRDAGANPAWHRKAQDELRRSMPLLAEALDRLSAENR